MLTQRALRQHVRTLSFEASGSTPSPGEGGSAADYSKKLQDDKTFDTLMGRDNNPADRCARGVFTTYLAYQSGGASGTPKTSDLKACATHFQQLFKDPKGTIFETTGITAGQDVFGCGAVCGGTLGVLLGPHVTAWLGKAFNFIGLSDCRDKGPGIPEWALRIYSGMLNSNTTSNGGVMVDPQAPDQFWELAVKTAEHLVNTGLENCKGPEWFDEKKNELIAASTALAAASSERSKKIVFDLAAKKLAAAGISQDDLLTESGIKVANAAFLAAAAENRLYTEDRIAELSFNIANYVPGTLTAPAGRDEKGEWLKSAVHQEAVKQGELLTAQADAAVQEAAGGSPLPLVALFSTSGGGGGGAGTVAVVGIGLAGLLWWLTRRK